MAVRGLSLLARSPLSTSYRHAATRPAAALLPAPLHGVLFRSSSRTTNSSCCKSQTPLDTAFSRRNLSGTAAAAPGRQGPTAAPMDPKVLRLVTDIHDSPTQAVLYATGGGFQVRHSNLCIPLQAHKPATFPYDGYQQTTATCAAQALTWLLTVAGASRTVLDARVPYAQQALADALGGAQPATFASPETARCVSCSVTHRGCVDAHVQACLVSRL